MGIQVDSDNTELSHNRSVTCYPTIVKYPKIQILVPKYPYYDSISFLCLYVSANKSKY